jgi:type I restriction enzyme S subunit
MSNWVHATLQDICRPEKGSIISGPFGSNISSKFFVDEGVPVIRGNNLSLSLDKFYDDGFVFVTQEKADELNCYALEGDLLFTAAGTIGQVGILEAPLKYEKYVISNKQLRARIDTSKVDLLYAYYWFSSAWMQDYFIRNNKGSTVPLISLSELKDAPISYPEDISAQKRIVAAIEALSQKIETKRSICTELESTSKTIYDYWFTQFDFPDANGKPYRSSGGAMVWNEQLKRAIPQGWDVGNLYAIAELINGLACQKYRAKEGEQSLPVVKIKEMHEGISDDTESVSANIPVKHKIFDGDILFSWSATLEVMYWFGGDAGLNQHIFKVVPKVGYSKEYVYHQFSAYVINFVKMAEARKTTMGHITTDHLDQSRIVLPPSDLMQVFSEIVAPIHKKIGHCRKENRELTKLRDWLLPMLMNGQATVGD